MTFVAILHADQYPNIVVDSLVSRPADLAAGIPTPLLATPDAREGLGFQPVGLGRKFRLLPDRSLFLYAGTVGSARFDATPGSAAASSNSQRHFAADVF